MRILVLGSDGYIGHSLSLHLLKSGHSVFMADNYSRRRRVSDLGSKSLTPIFSAQERKAWLREMFGPEVQSDSVSLGTDDPGRIRNILAEYKPSTIVHLAEQPSAPWSMKDPYNASITQFENVIGTLHLLWAMKAECPNTHLVKLGTMGEYGTPPCDIPEGRIPNYPTDCCSDIENMMCPMAGLLFPRTAGSWYHLSKVHDTHNIEFACRNWGLRSTDIMQGVVFGLNDYDSTIEITRFDYDECFGTAINRFCAQALYGMPLTVYGLGEQTRGFLPLKDSIKCLTIAIERPPIGGQYRTFNQFENIYSINQLARMVVEAAEALEIRATIKHLPNPRIEDEEHYYNPTHDHLERLGYKPTTDIRSDIHNLLLQLQPYAERINKYVIKPEIYWR